MIKKSIPQYSLVDLLEIMRIKNHQEYHLVIEEFQKRKPSDKELETAKKGLEIRIKSRNKPLSVVDKIYCLLIPLTAPRNPFISDSTEINNEHERHLNEFKMYGETKRVEELKQWQTYGRIIYISLLGLWILILLIFLIISIIRQSS